MLESCYLLKTNQKVEEFMGYHLPKCNFRPETKIRRFFTRCFRPIMRWLSGASTEEPQSTHFWNCHRISLSCFAKLNQLAIEIQADQTACRRYKWKVIPIFHMPRFGGWKKYIVLEPVEFVDEWFVGWGDGKAHGISRIPVLDKVRVLKGSRITQFVGINAYGKQIKLMKVGCGQIGDGGPWSHLPFH
jgi:hypothetical protein